MRTSFYLLIFFLIISAGCGNRSPEPVSRSLNGDKDIERARRFLLERKKDYTVVKILNPWQGADNISLTTYLVRKGSAIPDGIDSSDVIFVPIQSIICMSTTHLSMIEALGMEETISGISGKGLIYSPNLNRQIVQKLIPDVGYEAGINNELILEIKPDLLMMYGVGNESAGYVNRIRELGIKVLFNADYLETDPLGKAEWIKLFGALFCKEETADSIFRTESELYITLKENIRKNVGNKPEVLLGLPFQDTWFISPGNSYISKLIEDAGGNYLWSNTVSEVSMPFGLENVFMRAVNADFWLNAGTIKTKDDISAIDHRLAELRCFKNGNIYNNNKRITDSGGNDYWESGSLHPHLILKDIAAILHPELFEGYELLYYRKVI